MIFPKKIKRKKLGIVTLVVLTLSLLIGIYLVRFNQDLRRSTSEQTCIIGSYSIFVSNCVRANMIVGSDYNTAYRACSEKYFNDNQCILDPSITDLDIECRTDSDCKSPRKCQNNQCIGNPSENLKLKQYAAQNKCTTNADCKSGKTCVIRVCY